jgi:hypothetical protein
MSADLGRLFSSPRAYFHVFASPASRRPDRFASIDDGLEPAVSVITDSGSDNGNPKVSTVFWRQISDFVEDLSAEVD